MSVFQGARRAGGGGIQAHLGSVRTPKPAPEPEPVADEPSMLDSAAFGADPDGGEDLSQLTRAQLLELARERGIAVPGKATKAQIAALIEGAE